MLSDVPVVDRAIGVASSENLHVAARIFHVCLAIIDVVLVKGLFRLHHSCGVKLSSVKEDSAAAESVLANSCSLCSAVTRVERAAESPRTISLLLENERNIVVTTSDISSLADEDAGQDGVSAVDNTH